MFSNKMTLDWDQLANQIGAQYQGKPVPFQGLSHDTRTLEPGQAFIAIVGHQTDGHQFVAKAIERGAACVIVSEPTKVPEGVGVVNVSDTTIALGQLAKVWRAQFSVPIVGITGSMGKTTTKECLGAILSSLKPTLMTAGNWNNYWGMPLSILQLQDKHKAAVIEMGISEPGEMAKLASIAQPTVAIITKIAGVHVTGLGPEEMIAQEKSIIFEHLPASGTALAPFDRYLDLWQQKTSHCRLITCGVDAAADVMIKVTHGDSKGTTFEYHSPWGKATFELPLPGAHQAWNAMFAISAACLLGVKLQDCQTGLSNVATVPGRLRFMPLANGSTIIDDSYSGNPVSVRAALDVLAMQPGRKIFVFGDMKELDPNQEVQLHQAVGEYAKAKGVEQIWSYGQLAQHALDAFDETQSHVAQTHEQLIQQLQLSSGDACLVKGSNSNQLFKVVEKLCLRYNEQAPIAKGKLA